MQLCIAMHYSCARFICFIRIFSSLRQEFLQKAAQVVPEVRLLDMLRRFQVKYNMDVLYHIPILLYSDIIQYVNNMKH